MGQANRNRRRKARRAFAAQQTRLVAERALRAARASEPAPPADCPLTDISKLLVSPEDVEKAGTASQPLIWYVARCAPMGERKVLAACRERRFCAYLPNQRGWRWTRGHKRLIERPLFVGYLFIGLAGRQSIYDVAQIAGVEGFVESDGRPARIDPWLVLQIASLEAIGTFDHTGPRKSTFAQDQLVRVVGGQFIGWLARVVGDDGERVRVQFEADMFRGSAIPLKVDQVAAVVEAKAA